MKSIPILSTACVAVWALSLIIAATASAQVTIRSLLDELTDPAAVARWPQPEFTCKQPPDTRPPVRPAFPTAFTSKANS